MLEKEAKEWANKVYPSDGQAQRYLLMGVEFGYNKANEWHYVKDGDLPKENKDCLVLFHNKYSDNIVKDISRYSVELKKWWFIHDLKDMEEEVIAWKEIVLPELKGE